jgi:hypothetical protein
MDSDRLGQLERPFDLVGNGRDMTCVSSRVHRARPSRHAVARRGTDSVDLVLRGAARHLKP